MAEIDGRAAPLATLAAEYELDDVALQALGPTQCAGLLARIDEGCVLYRVHVREGAGPSPEHVAQRLSQAAAVLYRTRSAPADGDACDVTFASDTPELELLQILEGTHVELERVPRRARLSRPPPATAISIRPAAVPALAVPATTALSSAERFRSGSLTSWVAGDVLPVEVQRLDRLVEVVGELGIVQAGIGSLVEKARAGAGSAELLCDAQRLQRSFERSACALRACALDARKVPMVALLDALGARGRAFAAGCDKSVEIVVEDTALELDKQVVDVAFEPLCKWLRHVIADGIEARGERAARGKPSVARIELRVRASGASQLVLDIDDDGAGFERMRPLGGATRELTAVVDVRADARHGLDSAGASQEEPIGRGAELAKLRDDLRALSSSVEGSSESARNRVTVSLPVTRALVSMLLVTVRGRPYLLPLAHVQEVSRRAPANASSSVDREPIDLGDWLSLPLAVGMPAPRHVVTVRHGARQLAVLVDRAIAQQSVYLKPLGPSLNAARAVSGAAELGDGRLALVLDPAALFDERARSDAPTHGS